MPKLSAKNKAAAKRLAAPLWTGPCDDGPNGGITFSMLNRFLSCRERFRVAYVEGLKPLDGFNHRIEYGNMWHVCEEALAATGVKFDYWQMKLKEYVGGLCKKYNRQQDQVVHWWEVCKQQFPVYVQHWRSHPDVVEREPVYQEKVFGVPVKLPSGRKVYLRGKWDSVDVIDGNVWIQENKTKGDVDELLIGRQLKNDLQSMMYITALDESKEFWIGDNAVPGDARIGGVRYNVVRRPLSGGKGNIKQHQPSKKNPQGETSADFYTRLRGLIETAYGPEWGMPVNQNYYFLRFEVPVTAVDIKRFQQRTLFPVLEQLSSWYEWISYANRHGQNPFLNSIHWQHPFGCTNIIDEYGASDLDNYLATGDMVGLERRKELFEELK